MTLYQYNLLDELEQLEALREMGIMVTERNVGAK